MDARSRTRSFFAAGLVALVALWWGTRTRRVEEPNPIAKPSPSASAGPMAYVPPAASEFPPELPSAEAPFPMAPPSPAKFDDLLAKYREFAVYPPWSRPHNDGTKYKLSWNEPVVSDLPFSDKASDPIHYRFAADRAHVMAGQPYTAWFEAWRGDDDTKRVPVKIVEAWVMVVSGPSPGRAVKLAFDDRGLDGDVTPGDLVYTTRFVPSSYPELKKARQAQLMVHVDIGGIQKPLVRDFTYSPRDVLTFGAARDVVRDGNLVFELDVEVHDAGEYTCEANLLTGDGAKAIGYSKVKPTLGAGPAKLAFSFFGKVIRDTWFDGPYMVRDVRCVLRQAGDEENIWAADARTHQTQPYVVEAFSEAEWQSPEKAARIAMLQRLSAQAKSGENPNPSAPKHIHVDPEGNEQVVVGADGKKLALPGK